eukprot:TRINITY_DN2625_c0_g1_i1.p1 TRINITY_DN2625_c0_g1~~TRINITY_DN2625_c0_g1_i1.p1  ORF type:complete len:293 (-),score=60.82 TRINITY_DN2625_c0_g1_i1:115-993(-)
MMKQAFASWAVPSVAAVVGATVAHVYYSHQLTRLNSNHANVVAENNHALERLQEHTISLACALDECQTQLGILHRRFDASEEQKEMMRCERDTAVEERTTAVAQLGNTERELEDTLARLQGAEGEFDTVEAALNTADQVLDRSAREMQSLRVSCGSLNEEVRELEAENDKLEQLCGVKTAQIETYVHQIRHLNDYIAAVTQRFNQTVASLEEQIASQQCAISQQQRDLDECYLMFESEKRKNENLYADVTSFLERHPKLDIEISLILKAERSKRSNYSFMECTSNSSCESYR